jgi:hypothetical protein
MADNLAADLAPIIGTIRTESVLLLATFAADLLRRQTHFPAPGIGTWQRHSVCSPGS